MTNTFNQLLDAMLTKRPMASGKIATKGRASSLAASADYAGTRTRAGKSANASSKRKYKSQK